ncbi:MAG: hypothetical protein U0441_21055 [Polyangiaceae bacterium]
MRTHKELESADARDEATTHEAARAVGEAIRATLDADDKTREPMNALVVWTELGRGLSGKLERQGADAGLLARLIANDSRARLEGAAPVDLASWAYRVPAEQRLTREDAARAFTRLERAIGDKLADHWADGDGGAHVREDFLAVVRGWFPIGLDIFRSLPAARGATEAEIGAALAAWCDRYLPKDTSGPEDLGVRRERGHDAKDAEVSRCC